MKDYSECSAPELVRMLGERFKDYRLRSQLTQKEVADLTGLAVPTVQRFEKGSSGNISLATFLLLMKAIGCIGGIDELMPEQPESLYLYNDNNKKVQRVRHKKTER